MRESTMIDIFFVFLAILGLSFLIFIHELGHYWMARRVGMRVETFSVGFGRPLYRWQRDGVNWQIGWLLFGGYVKIAGTETDGKVDPYSVPDGFFGKKPWDRIKVSFMGPFVNILFAFVLFAALWAVGGRTKNFAEFSSRIGWVDPASELYEKGVRPGDEMISYNDVPFHSYKDHLYGPMMGGDHVTIKGAKIDYSTGEQFPFEYKVPTYSHPTDSRLKTAGILTSARYLIYDRLPDGKENPLPEGSPLQGSGIQYGDRILWVDGELMYSQLQLGELLNDGRILVTIQRGGELKLRRVPRVLSKELRPNAEFKEELIDWQHEAGMTQQRFQDLYVLPYNLTHEAVVENELRFVDSDLQAKIFPNTFFSSLEEPLQAGDRIVAIQGKSISRAFELIRDLQKKKVHIVVERDPSLARQVPYQEAEASFNQEIRWEDLDRMANSITKWKAFTSCRRILFIKACSPESPIRFSDDRSCQRKIFFQTNSR
jgi:regulator of sigma E protease